MGNGKGGGAAPTVAQGMSAHLGDFSPYGDEPPRLCVGINDSPTDTPPEKSEDDTPVAEEPAPAKAVSDALSWIADRLQRGLMRGWKFNDAWSSQTASIMHWSPQGGPEEEWAQVVSELLIGATYAAPGVCMMGEGSAFDAAKGVHVSVPIPSQDAIAAGQSVWESMIFTRLERTRTPRAADIYGLKSWREPLAFEADRDEEPNDDPAISIVTACQHATTYVVISRGLPFGSMGAAKQVNCGLSAADDSFQTPLFGKNAYTDRVGRRWEALGGYVLPREGEQITAYSDVKAAIDAGVGPGSVIIFDPDHGVPDGTTIYMTPYELNKHGPTPKALWDTYLGTRPSAGAKTFSSTWGVADRQSELETDIAGARARGDNDGADKLEAQRAANDPNKRTAIPFTDHNTHYAGSHIYAVLRVHSSDDDKARLQCLDWNCYETVHTGQLTGSATLWERTVCLVEGQKRTSLVTSTAVAGLGVLPKHEVDQAQVDFLKKARPVGLMRFVLTRRAVNPLHDDVLFVSRLLRMYGKASDQNYHQSRLLWALRNTPGFTKLQPWCFVYLPRGIWAKAMWAQGAREASVADLVAVHGSPQSFLYLIHVLTNLDKPAGLAQSWTRKDGFKAGTPWSSGEPSDGLKSFIDPMRHWYPTVPTGFVPWDQCYFHKSVKLDESQIPALFRDEL